MSSNALQIYFFSLLKCYTLLGAFEVSKTEQVLLCFFIDFSILLQSLFMVHKCTGAHLEPGCMEARNHFSCYLHRLEAGIVQIILCSCTNVYQHSHLYLHCPNYPAEKSWKMWLITKFTNNVATKFKRLVCEHKRTRGSLNSDGRDSVQTPWGKYINQHKVGANPKGALTAFLTVPVTRSMHLPLLPPGLLTRDWQLWFRASLQGHFCWGAAPQGPHCVPPQWQVFSCWSDPAQRRAGLKPCCHRHCVIASCRESRSFPKLEYSSPVGELGWAKKTKSQARSAPAMATACRRGKRTFCHAGWEAGSCRQLHF